MTAPIDDSQKEKLLAKLALGWSVSAAAKAARMHRDSYYALRREDAAFAARADDAIESGTDHLEDEARRRAMKDSDTLIIFLLKARRPERYRDRADVQVSGSLRREYVVIRDDDPDPDEPPTEGAP